MIADKFQILATDMQGTELAITPEIQENGERITLKIAKAQLDGKQCKLLRVESSLTTAVCGDHGYMFYPTNFSYGVVKTAFQEREEADFRSKVSAMPVCGICENENAVFVHVQGCAADVRFYAAHKGGIYQISPEFLVDGDDPDEDILIVYHKMPYATYSDMARKYRKYQMEVKGCRPLKERAAERDVLREAADCIELRIRMGWKPQPTPVRRQTVENEPPMKVACDIATLNKIVDKMKEKRVNKAEICLVGWAVGGHDGRFPQHYPCDPRFGMDEELRAFIRKAQSYGYLVTCHSNSKGAYEIANNYDKNLLTMHIGKSGEPEPWLRTDYAKDGLQGGDPWHLCAKPAYEHYARTDFPVIRGYGFKGLHYVDELTACAPIKCRSKEHPTSRQEALEYYKKIAELSTELFGGFQSEAWFDFMNEYVDYVLYTSSLSQVSKEINPLFDKQIPFWSVTYHGIVMANATSKTVNYPIKTTADRLKFVEYGGRPVMYINSKFCGRDWMGVEDLYSDSDEAIERCGNAIKEAADEYDSLKYLQYEFIDNHEEIYDGVFRITYSDGTIITVDYNKGIYKVIHVG